jgi:hypothetical protein
MNMEQHWTSIDPQTIGMLGRAEHGPPFAGATVTACSAGWRTHLRRGANREWSGIAPDRLILVLLLGLSRRTKLVSCLKSGAMLLAVDMMPI